MRAARTLIVGLMVIMLGGSAGFAQAAPVRSDPVDFVAVTKVLVNRIGGVSVEGTMSCSATATRARAGDLSGDDQATDDESYVPIVVAEADRLVLLANPDNYVVSQPVGRRAMIQVTHESSRMNPCFTETATLPNGSVGCPVGALTCPWRTDRYGWDPDRLGPLFDYSPTGTFKAGSLNVDGASEDLAVIVLHQDNSMNTYMIEGGFVQPYSPVLRAIMTREQRDR